MPTLCCVPKCSYRGGHEFPRADTKANKARRDEWIHVIKRGSEIIGKKWLPKDYMVICHRHFTTDDYLPSETIHGTKRQKRMLKKTAVPSVFQWTKQADASVGARNARAAKREEKRDAEPDIDQHLDVVEEVIENPPSSETPQISLVDDPCPSHATTQTPPTTRLSIKDLKLNPEMLQYYTGLQNAAHFDYVFQTLGPAAYHLNYRWSRPRKPDIEDQFLITLIKLRLHTANKELAYLFDVKDFTIANIFVTWINFMYIMWKKINIWPSRDMVNFYMPECFKQDFPNTRLIIDGVEFPIQKPCVPSTQQVTYSSYKNRNTVKAVVGISPGGLASYIPDAYGGSASDRNLIEISDLPSKLDPKDSIMCDKGFDVQDIFAPHDIKINVPAFLRKKNQLSNSEVLHGRKISSKRVHVERVIGLAKTYKILTVPMSPTETQLSSRIIFVCFMLCNFRPSIVPI